VALIAYLQRLGVEGKAHLAQQGTSATPGADGQKAAAAASGSAQSGGTP
jgi:hypothetical protein